MKRAGIYARFSSEMQSDRSIEDQVALCRAYAERQGWDVAEIYADFAVSGASVHGRFSFERMVQDARRGILDILLTEDLDRLSRSQADIAALYERMTFAGIEIWTATDGRVSEMHVGLKGTMSALFLRNLALKTHRGLQGRVREGKSAGGRCFGYRVTGTGEREIEESEAAIVQRIFQEFAAGRNAREIAHRLNAEAVPGPRGGKWNASTINGSAARLNGILRNELYAGRMVWNRQRFVKNPDTGRRVSRANSAEARQTSEVPHLRIVPADLWTKVETRLAGRPKQAAHARRPRHLLSGLCRCGTCGGGFVVIGSGRLGCSTRRESGTCDNPRTVSLRTLERRILEALEAHLLHPTVIERAAQAYIAERRQARKEAASAQTKRTRRLEEINREMARIVGIMKRMDLEDDSPVLVEYKTLAAEAKALKAAPAPVPDVIEFHPNAVAGFVADVRNLRDALDGDLKDSRDDIIQKTRSLIESVRIFPRDDANGRDVELSGTLSALLGVTEQGRKCMSSVVAGAGFEPAAFRL